MNPNVVTACAAVAIFVLLLVAAISDNVGLG